MINPSTLRDTILRMIDEALPLKLAQVSAINADGTVNLAFGSGIIEQVSCSSGYPNRAVGDSVWVARPRSGNWEVLAKSGEQAAPSFATTDQLTTAVTDLDDDLTAAIVDLRGDIPAEVTVTFGSGAPTGTGWTQSTEAWFRDTGSGRRAIYFRTGTPPAPTVKPPKPPAPPKKTAPKPVTIFPADRGSWRPNGQEDDTVWQGDWTGRGDWTGGWFYGSAIADACAGKSVRSMTLRLSRSGTRAGFSRGVMINLGLHDRQTRGRPTLNDVPRTPFRLEPNQVRDWVLPADWVSQLASASVRGFGVVGTGQPDYMQYGSAAGRLIITFNAS